MIYPTLTCALCVSLSNLARSDKVSLLPSAMAGVSEAVRENVYRLLMRHSREAGGVLLELSDVSFLPGEGHGRIIGEAPHLHFRLGCKALLFAPQPGVSVVEVSRPSSHCESILSAERRLGLIDCTLPAVHLAAGSH